ncbi:hypothetical protein [Kitasatospora sp. NPDC127116]|uniref:hypothetical protein n=1 Tax=Kitasatospora sp. NPDC127116 TaxID=3345367 RepID=UPI00363CC928
MWIVVLSHVTLDDVMQGPGRGDEDTRDGFTHGGWAAERGGDAAIARAWGRRLAASGGHLLGRRTHQDVMAYWNTQDSPFRAALNNAPNYVASTALTEPLPWPWRVRVSMVTPMSAPIRPLLQAEKRRSWVWTLVRYRSRRKSTMAWMLSFIASSWRTVSRPP